MSAIALVRRSCNDVITCDTELTFTAVTDAHNRVENFGHGYKLRWQKLSFWWKVGPHIRPLWGITFPKTTNRGTDSGSTSLEFEINEDQPAFTSRRFVGDACDARVSIGRDVARFAC